MAQYIRTYHDNAKTQLKEEYYEVNGKIEGVYKKYYYNGQIYIICNFINGILHGEYKSYHKNGQLFNECYHVDGKLNGEYKQYHNDGQVWTIIKYVNHKKVE
jgi:uncharacterized protein